MPQQIQISEMVAARVVETDVSRNVSIPGRLPPAERVVSANARVEITDMEAGSGTVTFSGIIRATVHYASAEDPANIESISRNFNFTDRVSVPGARPGYNVSIEAIITDIDFYLIEERLIGLEFTVESDIEITTPEAVEIIGERPGVEFRRQQIRIRRQLRERNYDREFSTVERLATSDPAIRRIISVESDIQLIDIIAGYDEVTVRGVINSDVIYVSREGQVEYVSLESPFDETFDFRGVTPDMSPFVEATVLESEAERTADRRIRLTTNATFKILVVVSEVVNLPIGVITPGNLYPVTRTVLIERIVTEERIRIQARGNITVPEGNPDVARVIRATSRLMGNISAETESGGVSLDGDIDANVLYVADLPQQPVYFAAGTIPFSYFVNISEVTPDMDVVADARVISTTASEAGNRTINVRSTIEVNLLVTERIRIPIVIDISEQPVEGAPTAPSEGGFISYTVQSGDTLYLIAQRYGVTVEQLININDIDNPSQLNIGQQILIPG